MGSTQVGRGSGRRDLRRGEAHVAGGAGDGAHMGRRCERASSSLALRRRRRWWMDELRRDLGLQRHGKTAGMGRSGPWAPDPAGGGRGWRGATRIRVQERRGREIRRTPCGGATRLRGPAEHGERELCERKKQRQGKERGAGGGIRPGLVLAGGGVMRNVRDGADGVQRWGSGSPAGGLRGAAWIMHAGSRRVASGQGRPAACLPWASSVSAGGGGRQMLRWRAVVGCNQCRWRRGRMAVRQVAAAG